MTFPQAEIDIEIERLVFECERYQRLSGGFSAAHILSQGLRFIKDQYGLDNKQLENIMYKFMYYPFVNEYFSNHE